MAKVEVQESTGINAAKLKALQATIDKIEKDYGKGTIMKLGISQNGRFRSFRAVPLHLTPHSASVDIHAEGSSRSTDRNQAVRPHSLSTPSLRRRSREALPPSSMQNTLSTGHTPGISALTSRLCLFHSLTTESRHWRLQTTLSVPERSTSS